VRAHQTINLPKKAPPPFPVTGHWGVRHRGNDSAESTLPDSTAVPPVLPGNRREYVVQHNVIASDDQAALPELGSGLFERSAKIPAGWVHELQHRYSNTLLGESFFDVVYLSLAQLCFEQGRRREGELRGRPGAWQGIGPKFEDPLRCRAKSAVCGAHA
jgi:hypothetical protein